MVKRALVNTDLKEKYASLIAKKMNCNEDKIKYLVIHGFPGFQYLF